MLITTGLMLLEKLKEMANGQRQKKKLFFKRVEEVGVNGQWGIFSTAITGRVGYQCANFYRQLIENNEVNDSRYVLDESGKAHFMFKQGVCKKKTRKANREKVIPETIKPQTAKLNPKPSRKRKRRTNSNSDDNDYQPPASWTKAERQQQDVEEQEKIKKEKAMANPLPDYTDPITFEPVEQPAISPYGHVAGYKNWLKWLATSEPSNTCPFTGKPLKKRDLVLLTWDNIDQYRDKIVNL